MRVKSNNSNIIWCSIARFWPARSTTRRSYSFIAGPASGCSARSANCVASTLDTKSSQWHKLTKLSRFFTNIEHLQKFLCSHFSLYFASIEPDLLLTCTVVTFSILSLNMSATGKKTSSYNPEFTKNEKCDDNRTLRKKIPKRFVEWSWLIKAKYWTQHSLL